jgi:hypothetical protein
MRNSELKIALDTSPLITLCSFRVQGKLAVEYILPLVDMMVVETVALEATANLAYPDAISAKNLLDSGRLPKIPIPSVAVDTILDEYGRLGQGERDTIRLGLDMPDVKIILDDHLAFVVGCRFGLAPILLLDLVVLLANEGNLEKQMAVDIVNAVSDRYSKPFIKHTLYKLGR